MSNESRSFEVEDVSHTPEELIITGMIVSTDFLKKISKVAKPEYFKNETIKVLVEWVMEFYWESKCAPKTSITEIFEVNRSIYDADEVAVVRKFLRRISSEYSSKEFNVKYILNTSSIPYLEKNALEYKANEVLKALKRDDTEKAKQVFDTARRDVALETTQVFSPTDPDYVDRFYGIRHEEVMKFHGALGEYLSPLRRGKFIALLGPTKRGKSWWLSEFGYYGCMSGLNVLQVQFEMDDSETAERTTKRVTGKDFAQSDYDTGKRKHLIPVIDCEYNQSGECEMDECESPNSFVLDTDGNRLLFEEVEDHIPCTYCRGHKDYYENFKASTWFIEEEKEFCGRQEAMDTLKSFVKHSAGGSIKTIVFPIGTGTIQDIEDELDTLELMYGWICDMVVTDSADIMQKNTSAGDRRFQLGEIWEEHSRMAKSRNALVISASQGTRASFKKDRLETEDITEDISKAQVLDGLIAINETGHNFKEMNKKSKYWNVQYLEWLLHRYKKVTPGLQCMTLNNLELGQICLDSEIVYYK